MTDRSSIDLSKISVFAPEEVSPEEMEIGGAWVPGTHLHLLQARGWTEHEDCVGGCNFCVEGLVPSSEEVSKLAGMLEVDGKRVREALIALEKQRLEGDRYDPGSGGDSDQ